MPFTPRRFGWLIATSAVCVAVAVAAAESSRPAPEVLLRTRPMGLLARAVAAPGAVMLQRPRACGTAALTPVEAEAVASTLARWRDEHLTIPAAGTVRVAFHVITARGEGGIEEPALHDLIAALDRSFEGSGYRFELASVDHRDEPEWLGMTPGSLAERRTKQALAVDPARRLNLYLCALAPGLAGWGSQPWSAPEESPIHGVVLDPAALQDVRVAAHQVAHYLGLAHPEPGEPAGDDLGAGQIERMRSVVQVYKPSLFTIPAPAGGRPEISPADGAEPEDGRVLAYRGAIPNPFRAETALRFTLPFSQPVTLRIYGVTGQLVRTLVDATLPPGDHSAMFRAGDLPSGAYFAVLRAGSVQMTRTLMLIR